MIFNFSHLFFPVPGPMWLHPRPFQSLFTLERSPFVDDVCWFSMSFECGFSREIHGISQKFSQTFSQTFSSFPSCLTLHIEVPGIFIGYQSACTKMAGIGRCSFGQLGGALRLKPPGISMWFLFFSIYIYIYFQIFNENFSTFWTFLCQFYFILGCLRFKVQRFPIFQ